VVGHDIATAPDRSVGFFGRMGVATAGAHHVAFDPLTLEMIGAGRAPGDGWRGGGHGVYLADGALLSTERALLRAFTGTRAITMGGWWCVIHRSWRLSTPCPATGSTPTRCA